MARGQRTDINVVAEGPPHAPTFKAMLSFQAWNLRGAHYSQLQHPNPGLKGFE